MKRYFFLIFILVFVDFYISAAVPFRMEIKPIQNKVQAFEGNGEQHVVYELLVTNFNANPMRITAINIQGLKCKHLCSLHKQNRDFLTPKICKPNRRRECM